VVHREHLGQWYITLNKKGSREVFIEIKKGGRGFIKIQQNVNAKVISERLGHSSVHITLNQYSHVLLSMQKDVANRLDELFK
jgi:integrase